MNEKIKELLITQAQKVISFRQALTSESDRGCALFAAAYLDVSLSDLLYVSLVADKSIEKDLFEGTAPLSNFSSRIKFAYYLGLISRSCRRDLDNIRRIRNDFAHNPEIISFDTQSICDRCKNLSFSYQPKGADPRSHFTAAAMRVLGHIHVATLSTTPHIEKPDDMPTEEDKEENRQRIKKIVEAMNEVESDSSTQRNSTKEN
ncbi:MltR family transcriptional regulator [candidate division KSB1 bacterium]|nr:MltR family transcriptional regulator [candidate division KSB1 bacterium]